ncbi:MAG: TonB-dependent receptor [Bacteroidia bacterium]|nr:MAG: TonB-dependent receptor [Bacteroidia bacterium]
MKSIVFLSIICSCIMHAQNSIPQDTTKKIIELEEIEISGKHNRNKIQRLKDIDGVYLNSAKKNEVINLVNADADLTTNNARQVFAKVPGVNVWENDGSGIQVGVATRGLSPNRSWEFNVRQNGYDIAAEIFGYPEAYYNPPMEAVEKITLIRGSAALQYGPQFGGLLNYQIKKGNKHTPIEIESQQTYGSYNLFNSYNAIGGTYKNFNYYAYFHHRSADGWRQNSRYFTNTGYIALNYEVTKKLTIGLEYTRMNYLSQQAGGLTDSLFNINPQQSFRSRNWFNVPWNVYAINTTYKIKDDAQINVKIFGTVAERNSVGFTKAINIKDTFNITIQSYNPRQIDRDKYNNIGTEIRYLQGYYLFNSKHYLSAGIRAYKGNTKRNQAGIGNGNSDFDLNIYQLQNGKEWGRSLNLNTTNYAAFVENSFHIGKRWSIVPGIRYEIIESSIDGYINTTPTGTVNLKSHRSILLTGIGTEFKVTEATNLYANYSQAYRPVLFSDLTPPATNAIIDPNLKDASGYNIDGGYRGAIKDYLNFDIGGFYLFYNNRIGTITKDGVPYRTNIGASVSKGIETFIEIDPIRIFNKNSKIGYITFYAAYTYMNAEYTRWDNPAIINDPNKTIVGKKVEYAPENIGRYGINYYINGFSISAQLSQVSDVFTDAQNTIKPSKDATVGLIKGYQVFDINSTWTIQNKYIIKWGINNVTDEKYATRRAGGYPGPGLMPGNGRTYYVSLGIKL